MFRNLCLNRQLEPRLQRLQAPGQSHLVGQNPGQAVKTKVPMSHHPPRDWDRMDPVQKDHHQEDVPPVLHHPGLLDRHC